jgi:hypothetical protein
MLRAYRAEFWLSMRSLMSAYGLLGVVSGGIVLLLLYLWGVSLDALAEEMRGIVASAAAALIILSFWAFLNFFFCMWRAKHRVSESGMWHNDTFIYNTPRVVAMYTPSMLASPGFQMPVAEEGQLTIQGKIDGGKTRKLVSKRISVIANPSTTASPLPSEQSPSAS